MIYISIGKTILYLPIDMLTIIYNRIIISIGNLNKILPKDITMTTLTLPTEKSSFSRKELFNYLVQQKPELTQNSFKWMLADLIKNKCLYKISSDSYSTVPCNKNLYKPFYSDDCTKLLLHLTEFYPDINFVVFESFLLNEFVNHQISQNTIVIMVEKDSYEFIFDHLNSEYEGRVLLSPDKETLNRYWTSNCIIVESLISESPIYTEAPHKINMEKLLVDIVADKIIPRLFTHSEYELIFEEVFARYNIDSNKVKRYAKRRNAWEKISIYMKEIKNDN